MVAALLGMGAFLAIPVAEPASSDPPTSMWEVMREIAWRKRKAFDALLQGDTKGATKEAQGILEGRSTDTGSGP